MAWVLAHKDLVGMIVLTELQLLSHLMTGNGGVITSVIAWVKALGFKNVDGL